MFDNEKVDKLKYLPDVDKKYLNSIKNHIPWNIICSNMSIFSKKICLDEFDQYKYLETQENSDIFLIKSCHVFVDSDKKIIMYSCIQLQNADQFFKNIDNIFFFINNTDLTNAQFIGKSFVICERWYESYGHFIDEMFNIFDFCNRFVNKSLNNYTCLQNFSISSSNTQYLVPKEGNKNYKEITSLLFNKSLNIQELNFDCFRLQNLILISHHFNYPTFHLFPKTVTTHILNKTFIENTDFPKNLFLTRTAGLHIKRIVDNLDELNIYFSNKYYTVINPEVMNYGEFVNYVRCADNLYLTWGGIMVAMIYTKPSCNIYILQGASYDSESLYIIRNLISNYSLENRIKIIKHSNNIINIADIEKHMVQQM